MSMLLTLLSPLFGGVINVIPDVVSIFRMKEETKREIELYKAKAEYATVVAHLELDKINVEADIREGESLRDHDSNIDGGKFMDALRASVRPVITYFFFAMFVWSEWTITSYLINNGATITEVAQYVWNEETRTMFGVVLGFWFGSRAIKHYREQLHNYGYRLVPRIQTTTEE